MQIVIKSKVTCTLGSAFIRLLPSALRDEQQGIVNLFLGQVGLELSPFFNCSRQNLDVTFYLKHGQVDK